MDDLAEKRVYADRAGATELLVAAAPGLVSVSLAAGRVGEFGLAWRGAPADIAAPTATDADGPRLAVATAEDVLLAPQPAADALEASDFGPAVAVTFDSGRVVAGAADGRVAVAEGAGWTSIGTVPAPLTALAGDLVATGEGVYRLEDGDLRPAGLRDVEDVAHAAGVPLAATTDGLYELGNGWLEALTGDFELVAGASDGRAHAATAATFHERSGGRWQAVDLPVDGPIGAVAYAECLYVLTVDGELLVRDDDGWRPQPLGVDGVVAAVVV